MRGTDLVELRRDCNDERTRLRENSLAREMRVRGTGSSSLEGAEFGMMGNGGGQNVVRVVAKREEQSGSRAQGVVWRLEERGSVITRNKGGLVGAGRVR